MNLTQLSEPFKESEIEWRIGRSGKKGGKPDGKIWATCFAYVSNRAIMDRLDEVCGATEWKNEFEPWQVGTDHGVKCGVSIHTNDQWITKYDGANPTNMEPIKGGFSDSMKRAAVQWGMGRYLYSLEEEFVTIVNQKDEGAKYAQYKNKDGTKETYYWTPPTLPVWALPKEKPTVTKVMDTLTKAKDYEAVTKIMGALDKYEFSKEEKKDITECRQNVLKRILPNEFISTSDK
jgi:hypothetical protein